MKSLLFAFLLVISLSLSVHHKATNKLIGHWTLIQVGRVSPSQPTKVTISSDKIILRYCNYLSFPYTIKESDIDVKPVVSTSKTCQDNMKPTEERVIEAFTNAKRYQASPGSLTLYGSKGQALAILINDQ